MSRILESESDNDESGQSSSTNSTVDLIRGQPTRLSKAQTIGSGNASYMVQNKLEQFSRRLSMLGLGGSQEENQSVGEESISAQNIKSSEDSITTTKSGNINTEGIAVPKQEVPMTTSLILTKLPKATDIAIKKLHEEDKRTEEKQGQKKVQLKFQSIGSIPQINPQVCKISAAQPFSLILSFLVRKLRVDHVYCYINNSFAPNPQQLVGDLWSQFKVDDELIVGYCGNVAFG